MRLYRPLVAWVGLPLCALALCLLPLADRGQTGVRVQSRPVAALNGLQVKGNQLEDGSGNPVRFTGVDRSGSEYACIQGWGIFDGPADLASVQAIASWHVNAVRVTLNEDCWLGINGVPAAYGGANYQNAIQAFVNLLNSNGIYVELSLIWGAPGTTAATSQPAAPDEDHSPAFWTSVATMFKSNPNVVFGVWGETTVSWSCFLNGCSNEAGYTTAGTQQLVSNIRATGATQVISVPCINYANDCYDSSSANWLAYEPTDPNHALIAEAHVYGNNTCGAQSNGACLQPQYGNLAATVPVFWGETGETYDDSECTANNMKVLLPWADQHNVGYLTWTWDTWGNCDALISDYTGTPNTTAPSGAAYGQYVHDHLAGIGTSKPTVTMVSPNSGAATGGTSVAITGTNFTGATAVKFGAIPAATFTVNTATSISATSPAGLGPVDVTVTTPSGTSATSAADQFTYAAVAGCYFNWYDHASVGMVNDNIHLLNTSGSTAHYVVALPGATPLATTLAAGAEGYLAFPVGTIGGPVTVSSDQVFAASQRVQYFQSFNEVWCEKSSQAATTLFLPWYDKASTGMVGDNVHVLNPGTVTAHVTVNLPGQTALSATVNAGAETYLTFPTGTIGGPVKITSDQPVLAAQRVQYYQTFNEEVAQAASNGQTTGYFNWFDNASTGMFNDHIHVVNPGATTAHVTMDMPGQTAVGATIAGGGTAYLSFPSGVIGGPVTVTSDQAVLATQRVQYYQSFNEVPLAGAASAASSLHIMWFDKASSGMVADNIHLLNPGATVAHVTITLSGASPLNVTVAAGAEAYATFPAGTIGGPLAVTSDQPILAAQRVQYYQTFNEVAAT